MTIILLGYLLFQVIWSRPVIPKNDSSPLNLLAQPWGKTLFAIQDLKLQTVWIKYNGKMSQFEQLTKTYEGWVRPPPSESKNDGGHTKRIISQALTAYVTRKWQWSSYREYGKQLLLPISFYLYLFVWFSFWVILKGSHFKTFFCVLRASTETWQLLFISAAICMRDRRRFHISDILSNFLPTSRGVFTRVSNTKILWYFLSNTSTRDIAE